MAATAFQIQYRQEFIAGFEQHRSLMGNSVTNEAVIKGNQATFLVADSGGATAVTRGVNGLIPARNDNLNQPTATLQEWHDLPRRTGFNIFASQGDGKRIMQMTSMGVINRKIDQDIIGELSNGTNDTGASKTMSLNLATYALTGLQNNQVPMDGNIWVAITPAALAFLLQTKEFANADYVSMRPLDGTNTSWKDEIGFYSWMNMKWYVHPQLPGFGTNAAKCFMYHSSAIGHATDIANVQTFVGYDEEQDYSYCRTSVYMGSKLLQNAGVVAINHDDSSFILQ